jgi:hypothetical protein
MKSEILKGQILTIGTALSVVISWSINKSILWAIIHGALSWFYIVYHIIGIKIQLTFPNWLKVLFQF